MLVDVFVYGSLLRGLHNHHRLETGLFRRLAVTRHPNFRLVNSGHGYPFALDSSPGRPGTAIKGELWSVTEPVLAALDELEGHPDFYRRRVVELDADDSAWMYILHDPVEKKWIASHPRDYPDVWPAGDWRLYYAPETSSSGIAAAAIADGSTSSDAVASRTVQQLVDVMGFPADKAAAAVDAIDDKSDVSRAVVWLVEQGEEDHGGAVEFVHCPHLDDPSVPLIDPALLAPATHANGACCAHGCASKEQWVCLQCAGVHCGRYVEKHALAHYNADPTHMTAASLADSSVHCYKCDACESLGCTRAPCLLLRLTLRPPMASCAHSTWCTPISETCSAQSHSRTAHSSPCTVHLQSWFLRTCAAQTSSILGSSRCSGG